MLEDQSAPAGAVPPDHPLAQVSPGYFTALGIPILRGRTFSAPDPTRGSRHGLVLAVAGVGVGLVGALAGTRLLRGLLFGVSPTDVSTLASTCALLLIVATLASWLPARRAASIDPMEALRRD